MPNYSKDRCKTNLKMAVNRFKFLQQKKTNLSKASRREIATLLENGKEESARIKVEHIIRDDFIVEAYEMLELFCDLCLARFGLIDGAGPCDEAVREAVETLIWAAGRTEVAEMTEIRNQLVLRYGREFGKAAIDNSSNRVNPRLIRKLSIVTPPAELVTQYLIEIAKAHNLEYEPSPSSTVINLYPGGLGGGAGAGGGGGGTEADLMSILNGMQVGPGPAPHPFDAPLPGSSKPLIPMPGPGQFPPAYSESGPAVPAQYGGYGGVPPFGMAPGVAPAPSPFAPVQAQPVAVPPGVDPKQYEQFLAWQRMQAAAAAGPSAPPMSVGPGAPMGGPMGGPMAAPMGGVGASPFASLAGQTPVSGTPVPRGLAPGGPSARPSPGPAPSSTPASAPASAPSAPAANPNGCSQCGAPRVSGAFCNTCGLRFDTGNSPNLQVQVPPGSMPPAGSFPMTPPPPFASNAEPPLPTKSWMPPPDVPPTYSESDGGLDLPSAPSSNPGASPGLQGTDFPPGGGPGSEWPSPPGIGSHASDWPTAPGRNNGGGEDVPDYDALEARFAALKRKR